MASRRAPPRHDPRRRARPRGAPAAAVSPPCPLAAHLILHPHRPGRASRHQSPGPQLGAARQPPARPRRPAAPAALAPSSAALRPAPAPHSQEFEGAAFWLVSYAAAQANFTLEMYILRLPQALWPIMYNDVATYIMHPFNNLGLDCLIMGFGENTNSAPKPSS